MAVILFMRVPEMNTARYDAMVAELGLDANPPAGLILHSVSEAVGAVNIYEIWQTPEAAESFVERTLRSALASHGVREPLSYRLEDMHNLFTPQMEMIERIGVTSLPGEVVQRTLAS